MTKVTGAMVVPQSRTRRHEGPPLPLRRPDSIADPRAPRRIIGLVDAVEVRTAAEVEQLRPDERQRLVDERTATDLAGLPPEFVAKARAEGRRLLIERNVIEADGA